MKDFFLSYATVDSDWAEWIAWQLEDAGYSVIIQAWDFLPGANFVLEIQKASVECGKTLAVLSDNYINRLYTQSEWAAAFGMDPDSSKRRLLPVRVGPCEPKGLLGQIVYVDLVGRSEESARQALLGAVHPTARAKPYARPSFPGSAIHTVKRPSAFPGLQARSERDSRSSQNFIHAKLSAKGLFDHGALLNPYQLLDATDDLAAARGRRVHVVVWLPSLNYLRSSPLQPFTPAAAICSTDPMRVATKVKTFLGDGLASLMAETPSHLRNDKREDLFSAMAFSLADCFIVAVTFPEIVLRVGRRRPELAYQAMADLFVFPLLEMHHRFSIEEVDLHFAKLGEGKDRAVLNLAKQGLKAVFSRRGTAEVHLVEEDSNVAVISWLARVLSWAVGVYHNTGNPKWIRFLEENFNLQPGDSSIPEGSPLR